MALASFLTANFFLKAPKKLIQTQTSYLIFSESITT